MCSIVTNNAINFFAHPPLSGDFPLSLIPQKCFHYCIKHNTVLYRIGLAFILLATFCLLSPRSSLAAYKWTLVYNQGGLLNRLACNRDCRYMLAAFLGKVLVSSDYGQTWIEHNPGEMTDQNWIATSVSPDGRYMMVGGWQWNNHLFISDNYGVTWTEVRPNPSVPATSWQGTAQSDDASVFYAFGWGDNAYRSLNQGADWTKLSIGHNNHYSVNTDQTGNLVLVGSDNDMKIFISRNQGVGWTTVQLDPTGFAQVRTTMSKNGQVMLAYTSGGNGQFYISTDAGYNWNLNSISQPGRMWVSAAVTDDDSLIAAVDSGNNNGRVWLSNNHGQTWTEERPRGDYGDSWRSAVFNSTGSRLYVANYGQIYSGISEVYQPDVGATGVDLNANLKHHL